MSDRSINRHGWRADVALAFLVVLETLAVFIAWAFSERGPEALLALLDRFHPLRLFPLRRLGLSVLCEDLQRQTRHVILEAGSAGFIGGAYKLIAVPRPALDAQVAAAS